MKESILKLLKESKKSLTREDFINSLNLTSEEDFNELDNNLEELLADYDIYKTGNDKFLDIDRSPLRKGTYKISKDGMGRINTEKKIYYVRDNESNNAIDGDTVVFEPLSKGKGNEAEVLLVINRDLDQVIGEVQNINDEAFLKTDNFKLDKLNVRLTDDSLVTGTKVIVKLKPTDNFNEYIGEVVRNIGYKDAPFVDIEAVAYKHGFTKDFKKESLDQVDNMPIKISDDELKGRLDLRNIEIFTIDGKDTKDIDDAISWTKLPNGNDLVGVHIADVTHYMPESSPLDKEAFMRSTSGYFSNTVIPMLPQKMSNGICSLNPNVDRLTMSIFAEVDSRGEIVDSFITPSVINSKKQMNYDDVNKVIRGEEVEGYEEFANTLREMQRVSVNQINNRDRKGSLDMDSKELKIYCDETGKPDIFSVKKNMEGENLIESFMLIANQVAPRRLESIDAPCIYRVHERPDLEKIERFIDLYRSLGYSYNKEISNSSKSVQAILKDIQDKEEKYVLQIYLLRRLMKAEYSAENIGHSGLAMSEYSQFTSPIRRYSDDILHRLVKEYVCSGQKFEQEKKYWGNKLNKVYNTQFIDGPVAKEPSKRRDNEWFSMLPYMSYHISNRERQEIACEREVNRMKSAEYMADHIGDTFEGTVIGVNNKFLEIELDNMIDGNLPLENLSGDYYCNSDHFAAEDYKTGDAFHIGDRLEVQATYASKDAQLIEFTLSKVLSKVHGKEVIVPEPMNKGKRKELKKKHKKDRK